MKINLTVTVPFLLELHKGVYSNFSKLKLSPFIENVKFIIFSHEFRTGINSMNRKIIFLQSKMAIWMKKVK